MARKQRNGRKPPGAAASSAANAGTSAKQSPAEKPHHAGAVQEAFSRFAHAIAHVAGKPITFLLAVAAVLVWGATGPIFHYSDTWQLVINTSTTIITFLMVFLIQNTQNRDQLALQIKLAELIIAMRGAHNSVAIAEDMTEEDLERLHEEYRCRADDTLTRIEARRGSVKQ